MAEQKKFIPKQGKKESSNRRSSLFCPVCCRDSEFRFEYDTVRNEVYSCTKCGIRIEIAVR